MCDKQWRPVWQRIEAGRTIDTKSNLMQKLVVTHFDFQREIPGVRGSGIRGKLYA